MGDLFPFGLLGGGMTEVLRGVYQPIRQQMFPLNTSLVSQMQAQQNLIQPKINIKNNICCSCGKCQSNRDFNRDEIIVTQTAECWLTDRIERIRLFGRNWNRGSIKRIDGIAAAKQAPPAVGGYRTELSDNTGIPVRYLRNGADALYAYDRMPQGFREWLQKAQTTDGI